MIPIDRVIDKLNRLFEVNDLAGAGRLLAYWENEARALGDKRGLLEILSELIGYYRRTGEKEKGLFAVNEAFELIEEGDMIDSVSAATVYLNGATTMKAFGLAREAMPYYEKASLIYENALEPSDYRIAALYNNASAAYKDLNELEKCEECCYKAIGILKLNEGCLGEIAVTLINLAHLYYEQDPLDERVYEIMDKAWDCLNSEKNVHDGNFAFLCSKCYTSFGYFGYFERESALKALTEKIYEGN